MKQRFEHKRVRCFPEVEDLEKEGYELLAVMRYTTAGGSVYDDYILKRPVETEATAQGDPFSKASLSAAGLLP